MNTCPSNFLNCSLKHIISQAKMCVNCWSLPATKEATVCTCYLLLFSDKAIHTLYW